jgi:hypothetical protein
LYRPWCSGRPLKLGTVWLYFQRQRLPVQYMIAYIAKRAANIICTMGRLIYAHMHVPIGVYRRAGTDRGDLHFAGLSPDQQKTP